MGLGLVDKPHLQRFKSKLDETFVKRSDYATNTTFGIVRPDGQTVTVENGVLSANGKPLDYKTIEQKTNIKWIDDKDIYQVTYLFDGAVSCTGGQWNAVASTPYLLRTLISGYGGGDVLVNPDVKTENGQIYIKPMSDVSLSYFTVQYTKNSSAATVFDYTWQELGALTWTEISNLEWKGE